MDRIAVWVLVCVFITSFLIRACEGFGVYCAVLYSCMYVDSSMFVVSSVRHCRFTFGGLLYIQAYDDAAAAAAAVQICTTLHYAVQYSS